jgi:ribulose-phosphate 3-epimerase
MSPRAAPRTHTDVNSLPGQAFDRVSSLLETHGPVVLPALLLCDFGHLSREVERLEAAGAAALHLDVMDGRFVPQLSYGQVVVEAVRRAARVPIEVHLMIEEPERSIDTYATLGADVITVHVEGLADPRAALRAIADRGPRAHVAISPGTPVERIESCLDVCDGVLVMGVEPGYGGQPFNPVALDKLARLAEMRTRRGGSFLLGVDGGIALDTVGPAAAAGAELIVAGSAVIRTNDYARAIGELESLARDAA